MTGDENRGRKPAMAKIKGHTFDVVQFETLKAVVKELKDLEWFALMSEQNRAQGRCQASEATKPDNTTETPMVTAN